MDYILFQHSYRIGNYASENAKHRYSITYLILINTLLPWPVFLYHNDALLFMSLFKKETPLCAVKYRKSLCFSSYCLVVLIFTFWSSGVRFNFQLVATSLYLWIQLLAIIITSNETIRSILCHKTYHYVYKCQQMFIDYCFASLTEKT